MQVSKMVRTSQMMLVLTAVLLGSFAPSVIAGETNRVRYSPFEAHIPTQPARAKRASELPNWPLKWTIKLKN